MSVLRQRSSAALVAARARRAVTVGVLAVSGVTVVPGAATVLAAPQPPVAAQVHFTDSLTLPDVGPGTRRVTVCVVDSGSDADVTLQHALTERLGVDDGSGSVNQPGDRLRRRHGTLVSQVVAGTGPSFRTGVWPLAKLRTISAINRRGRFTRGAIALAIHACLADPQVLVINLSLGSSRVPVAQDLALALARARAAQVNIVVSAGNKPASGLNVLDTAPGVISVGGVDARGALCSTTHTKADVLGLSCGVQVTDRDGTTIARNGTSFAAPQASAILAAIRGHAPGLNADQAATTLISGAVRTSFAPVLNARGAMHRLGVSLPASEPLPEPKVLVHRRGGRLRITVSNRPQYAVIVARRAGRTLHRTTARRFHVAARGGPVRIFFEMGGVRSPIVRVAEP